jgi:hypothetical protein
MFGVAQYLYGCDAPWVRVDERSQYSDDVSWLLNTRSEITQTMREFTPSLPPGPARGR